MLAKHQVLLNVFHHLWSGGGSEGQNWFVGLDLPDFSYLEIRRSEIVAPLADAVCYIHANKAHLSMFEFGDKEFRC